MRISEGGDRPVASSAGTTVAPRVIACCGQMVIAGGVERMVFETLRVVNRSGGASHAIVNGWENFRITPEIEASGSTWSVGPYYYGLTRRRLNPLAVMRMVIEVARVSANLIKVSRRFRPTHNLLPDFVAALRNAPALIWLRLCGVVTVLSLQNAPSPGRFYRLLWSRVVSPLVDRLVANSEFTRPEHVALGLPVLGLQLGAEILIDRRRRDRIEEREDLEFFGHGYLVRLNLPVKRWFITNVVT
jgi:hypothetical protein